MPYKHAIFGFLIASAFVALFWMVSPVLKSSVTLQTLAILGGILLLMVGTAGYRPIVMNKLRSHRSHYDAQWDRVADSFFVANLRLGLSKEKRHRYLYPHLFPTALALQTARFAGLGTLLVCALRLYTKQ